MNIYSELACLLVRLHIVGLKQLASLPDLELNIENRKVVFVVRFQKFQQI